MAEVLKGMGTQAKKSTAGLLIFALRAFTGMIVGLTLSLIGQEIIGYGVFSFFLVTMVVLLLFLKLSKNWGLTGVLVFDLIAVLVATLLRLYIQVAPGA